MISGSRPQAASLSACDRFNSLNIWFDKINIQEIINQGGESMLNELVCNQEILQMNLTDKEILKLVCDALYSKTEGAIDYTAKLLLLGYKLEKCSELDIINSHPAILAKFRRFLKLFLDWKFNPAEISRLILVYGNDEQLAKLQENSLLLSLLGHNKDEIASLAICKYAVRIIDTIIHDFITINPKPRVNENLEQRVINCNLLGSSTVSLAATPMQNRQSMRPIDKLSLSVSLDRQRSVFDPFRHIAPLLSELNYIKVMNRQKPRALKREFSKVGSVCLSSFFPKENIKCKNRRIMLDEKVSVSELQEAPLKNSP